MQMFWYIHLLATSELRSAFIAPFSIDSNAEMLHHDDDVKLVLPSQLIRCLRMINMIEE
uniref:Uncharacterized protein n=1 Tax=Rhizophora mucronata TaxID=61149 RepID=A0A2P2MRY4_RHIMU